MPFFSLIFFFVGFQTGATTREPTRLHRGRRPRRAEARMIEVNLRPSTAGDSFSESFLTQNTDRWDNNDDWLMCVGKQCVYLSRYNLQFNIPNPHGMLQIEMWNNCYQDHCCVESWRDKNCTPYSTGQLVSKKKYGYGSYRWHAIATFGHSPSEEIDVSSCFSLENDEKNDIGLGLSLCVSSKNPREVATVLQSGEYSATKYHTLSDDSICKSLAEYQIDYLPSGIKYKVNGLLIREIKADQIDIPRDDLQIAMGLFPAVDSEPKMYNQEEMAHHIVVPFMHKMQVFRVDYIKDGDKI